MRAAVTCRRVFRSVFVVACILAGVGIGGLLAPQRTNPYDPATFAPTLAQLQADLDIRTAVALRAHGCTEPAAWHVTHPDRFPRTMLVKPDGTFVLQVRHATFTPPAGLWVLGFCDR